MHFHLQARHWNRNAGVRPFLHCPIVSEFGVDRMHHCFLLGLAKTALAFDNITSHAGLAITEPRAIAIDIATAMAGAERRVHVILFPFMAQGHVTPFRCLAELVRRARPDALITMVATTPGVAEPLRAALPGGDDGVRVHELPFDPAAHGLPAAAAAGGTTTSITPHQLIALFLASESLLPPFRRLLAALRAADPAAHVHVMADMFLAGWTLAAARDAGASHSAVLTTGGYGSAVYFSLWDAVPLPLPATASPDDYSFPLPAFPGVAVRRSQLTDHLAAADGSDAWSAFIRRQIAAFRATDALLVNTAEHLEPKGLSMLRRLFHNVVPVYPVGPLLRRAAAPATEAKRHGGGGGAILAWLDGQPPGSVLYVSFGSQYAIGAPQMAALVAALERSARRFVWVVRPPPAGSSGEVPPEWVEGSGRGLVARCWAPQVEVLGHAATGAFLTHCGWNSAQEALAAGVPLLGWPISAEQFYNAKVLAEEMGVCVEVARGADDAVSAETLAAAVETVLGETAERDEMRRKAAEMKEVIAAATRGSGGPGSSVGVMERFFADVVRC